MRLAVAGLVALLSGCDEPIVESGPFNACTLLRTADHIGPAKLEKFGPATWRTVPMFTSQPTWWTPVEVRFTERWRGADDVVHALIPRVVRDGKVANIDLTGRVWAFARTMEGPEAWLPLDSIASVNGSVQFVNAEFESEDALRAELEVANANAECAFR